MWISFLLGNWRMIGAGLLIAGVLWRVDDRAYNSGYENAMLRCTKEIDKVRLEQQESCLKQSALREKSNAQHQLDKDNTIAWYDAQLRKLRATKAKPQYSSASSSTVDTSTASGLSVPTAGGNDLRADVAAFVRDAIIRDKDYLNCRAFVLDITSEAVHSEDRGS